MNIHYKALAFALLFAPAVAMSGDIDPNDFLYGVNSNNTTAEEMAGSHEKNMDSSMDDINKTIEKQPTAAGGKASEAKDVYGLPIHSAW